MTGGPCRSVSDGRGRRGRPWQASEADWWAWGATRGEKGTRAEGGAGPCRRGAGPWCGPRGVNGVSWARGGGASWAAVLDVGRVLGRKGEEGWAERSFRPGWVF